MSCIVVYAMLKKELYDADRYYSKAEKCRMDDDVSLMILYASFAMIQLMVYYHVTKITYFRKRIVQVKMQ